MIYSFRVAQIGFAILAIGIPTVFVVVGPWFSRTFSVSGMDISDGVASSEVEASRDDMSPPKETTEDEREVDLGVIQTTMFSHPFRFRNPSEGDSMTILSVTPSCSCISPLPDRLVYEPGESVEIFVEGRVPAELGLHAYTVTVRFQIGDRIDRLPFRLRLLNKPNLSVPEVVNLLHKPGEIATAEFSIVDFRQKPLKIYSFTATDGLDVQLIATPREFQPGWVYRFGVAWTGSMAKSNNAFLDEILWGQIVVLTNDELQLRLEIPVKIHTRSRLRVLPQTIQLRHGQCSIVMLDNREGKAVEIESIVSIPEGVRVTQRHLSSSRIALEIEQSSDSFVPGLLKIKMLRPEVRQLCVQID